MSGVAGIHTELAGCGKSDENHTAADERGITPIENKRFIGVYRRLSVAN
jgi:hypothetical protein